MNPIFWNRKNRSRLFAAALSLVSLSALGAAAWSTDSLLAPFRDGLEFASERSLSRDTHSLAVIASGLSGRIAGASVEVWRAGLNEDAWAASATTDSAGRAIFELGSGPYWVNITTPAGSGTEGVNLYDDERLAAYFDAAGEPHWKHTAHDRLEAGEDEARVTVRVDDRKYCDEGQKSCRAIPAPGAELRVFWVQAEGRVGLVEAKSTGDVSAAAFSLDPGTYELEIVYGGLRPTHRFQLVGDYSIRAYFDGRDVRIEGSEVREPVGVRG